MAFSLQAVPLEERPRERMMIFGPQVLSLTELITIILGQGSATSNVLQTTHTLLQTFGSLHCLGEASLEDIMAVRGIGRAKACQLKVCFEIARRMALPVIASEQINSGIDNDMQSEQSLVGILNAKIENRHKEHFFCISFNTRKKITAIDLISVGSLNANLIHPRELFDIAIRRHAAFIIIAHNHPSGDCEPSDEDIAVTKRLKEAGAILGISVVDHIIVSGKKHYSFQDAGLLHYK